MPVSKGMLNASDAWNRKLFLNIETKTKYRITQDMMQQDREFISSMLQPKTDTAYTHHK